jgi:hypothetical protein
MSPIIDGAIMGLILQEYQMRIIEVPNELLYKLLAYFIEIVFHPFSKSLIKYKEVENKDEKCIWERIRW